MSILSTVKKGYLYMKTSSGYIKLLPRTLASLVSLGNGNSVETEISNIKSAASNLSSTVSGHTTTLNSHGSSISAIKTKTDALKDAANKTVANNLTTTKDGYVLDARMGKSLQDMIRANYPRYVNDSGLNKVGERFYDHYVASVTFWSTHLPNNNTEIFNIPNSPGAPGSNNVLYYWIDQANSFVYKEGYKEVFPLPYVNPRDNSWRNSVGVKLNNGQLVVYTSTDWTGYGIVVTIKYALSIG